MYMRNKNNNYDRYSKYNIDGLPPNYSGQYTKESLRDDNPEITETDENPGETEKTEKKEKHEEHNNHREHSGHKDKVGEEEPNEKHSGSNSLFGNLFGGNKNKDGKKGGLLSGLFGKGGDKGKDKSGGFLSNIELEDLILIAVIFFLLKDGFEDDLILILAIILFAS